MSLHLARIGVVRTRPRRSTSIARIVFDQPNNSTVRATNHSKTSKGYHKHAPADHEPPPPISLLLLRCVVVKKPHATHWLKANGGTEQRADERDQAVELWYSTCNNVSHNHNPEGTREPRDPMRERVCCHMPGTSQEAHKKHFGRELFGRR
jgi:hypothetical protein